MNGFGILIYLAIEWVGLSFLWHVCGGQLFFTILLGKAFLAYLGMRWLLWRLRRGLADPAALMSGMGLKVGGLAASLIACVLLMLPGLLTDFVGLTLLIPGVRLLWTPLLTRAQSRMGSRFQGGMFTGGLGGGSPFGAGGQNPFAGGANPFGGGLFGTLGGDEEAEAEPETVQEEKTVRRAKSSEAPGKAQGAPRGKVVDAEFRVLDDED